MRIADTHASAGGANIAGVHTSIQNINVYSDGGAGTGLRVGAHNTSVAGRIVGYSGAGGKGVETGAGGTRSGCILSLHINNCETAWTNSNVGTRNIYIGSIWATPQQEIMAGSGPSASNGDEMWLINAETIDDSAEGRWLDNVLALNTLQAIQDVYFGRMLVGPEITPPEDNPDADTMWFYYKDDGGTTRPCVKDSSGTETCLTGGASAPADADSDRVRIQNVTVNNSDDWGMLVSGDYGIIDSCIVKDSDSAAYGFAGSAMMCTLANSIVLECDVRSVYTGTGTYLNILGNIVYATSLNWGIQCLHDYGVISGNNIYQQNGSSQSVLLDTSSSYLVYDSNYDRGSFVNSGSNNVYGNNS